MSPEVIPVDFKLSTGRLGRNLQLRLVAYGALLQEAWELPACRGFVHNIPQRQAVGVPLTPQLWAQFEEDLTAMRTTVELERMPPPTRSRARCPACEFRLFCNDV